MVSTAARMLSVTFLGAAMAVASQSAHAALLQLDAAGFLGILDETGPEPFPIPFTVSARFQIDAASLSFGDVGGVSMLCDYSAQTAVVKHSQIRIGDRLINNGVSRVDTGGAQLFNCRDDEPHIFESFINLAGTSAFGDFTFSLFDYTQLDAGEFIAESAFQGRDPLSVIFARDSSFPGASSFVSLGPDIFVGFADPAISIREIPEPATFGAFAAGLAAMMLFGRRRGAQR